jgi:hypothetical protein
MALIVVAAPVDLAAAADAAPVAVPVAVDVVLDAVTVVRKKTTTLTVGATATGASTLRKSCTSTVARKS